MRDRLRFQSTSENWQLIIVAAVSIPVFYGTLFLVVPHLPDGTLGWIIVIPGVIVGIASGAFASGSIL